MCSSMGAIVFSMTTSCPPLTTVGHQTSRLAINRDRICSTCDGRGGKEGAEKACATCNGHGVQIQYLQVRAVMWEFYFY